MFGIELESNRAKEAQVALPRSPILGPTDFLAADISSGVFSLAWINPPFDDEIGGGRRVEYAFVTRATQLLVTGGVVALVLPEPTLASRSEIKAYLLQHYRQLAVLRFPDAYRHFREVIAVGVKRSAAIPEHPAWSSVSVETLTEECDSEPWQLPVSVGPRRFRKGGLTEVELATALERSPLRHVTQPPSPAPPPRPPLPLAKGHISLLLAAGELDGIVQPPGEPPHVVRGTATKTKYVSNHSEQENADGSVTSRTTISERIVLAVRVAHADGRLVTFTNDLAADRRERRGGARQHGSMDRGGSGTMRLRWQQRTGARTGGE
jgi:hypothetical protein